MVAEEATSGEASQEATDGAGGEVGHALVSFPVVRLSVVIAGIYDAIAKYLVRLEGVPGRTSGVDPGVGVATDDVPEGRLLEPAGRRNDPAGRPP